MMTKKFAAFSVGLVVAFLLLSGCEKQSKDVAGVLVEVNGRQFRQSDYDLRCRTKLHLLEITTPKRDFEKTKDKAESSIRAGLLDAFIQESLIASAAEAYFSTNTALKAEKKRVSAEVREYMMEKFTTTSGTNTVDFAQLNAQLPEDERKCFSSMFETDVETETFFRVAYSNNWFLSDKSVEKALTNLVSYNERVQATNRLAFAFATNLWKQAVAGADFGALADKYSHDASEMPKGDLGECSKVDYADDEETWDAISALKEGEVTPPLMTFSGIEIFKLIRKVPPEESNSKEEVLHLAHILIRRAIEVQDYTPAAYKKEMEGVFHERIMKQVLVNEWKKATVKFPMGEEVLPPSNWVKILKARQKREKARK